MPLFFGVPSEEIFFSLTFSLFDLFAIVCQQQLTNVRQRQGSHGVVPRNRFRIRRHHILEDAYNQMSALSEEDLRGLVMYLDPVS